MTDGTGGPPGDFSKMLGDFSAQADAMVTAAKEGRFAVSPEMGEAYKTALQDYLDSWATNKGQFIVLGRAPELGTSPYALDVGKHATLVADGDEQSAKTQLEALQNVISRAVTAIETAKKNFNQIEHDNESTLKSLRQD
ncbi:hypothetical protein GCM10027598_08270 [Amycolatopsis oliviviridis]|uniref:Uncharacterized protein n=1 Tax=Amycolatopsis oliviviridis TaxID=1471590 RepID=A0ABQ3LXJ5_9PSEU|nr:hypothetical protein [Amycolatopsis oliviviridis]GHH21053.1 hypothetical protein GCM10017790_41680 [Amycolatopsis oliviviridis]